MGRSFWGCCLCFYRWFSWGKVVRRGLEVVVDKKKAKKRVFPTISVTGTVGRRRPRTRVLFMNTRNEVRVRHIPTTKCPVGKLPITKFSHGGLLGGISILFGLIGDRLLTHGVVGSFGPRTTMNMNKCTDNPALGVTKVVNVPALVRRRGSCTKMAGGLLTGGTYGVYITCSNVRHFFRGSGVVLAKGPIHRKLHGRRVDHRRTVHSFKLSPSGGAVLVMKKDLKTHAVGGYIVRNLSGVGTSNTRFV